MMMHHLGHLIGDNNFTKIAEQISDQSQVLWIHWKIRNVKSFILLGTGESILLCIRVSMPKVY